MDITNVTGSNLISSSPKNLIGYSFKATSDSEIIIRNGDDSSADGVVYLLLGEAQSVRDDFNEPIVFSEGVYVEVVSGSVVGAVWVA